MLKVKSMPALVSIVGKLDIKPIVEKLKNIDIFDSAKNADEAKAQLTSEKIAEIGFEVIAEIAPQLPKISGDIVELIATHNNVTIEEAGELDLIKSIKDLVTDSGVMSFFSELLRKKAERNF